MSRIHSIRIGVTATAIAAAMALAGTRADASIVIDLTGGSAGDGSIGDAMFLFDQPAGGSGLLNTFLTIQATGMEEGYNTSDSSPPFDTHGGGQTDDLQVKDIPVVTLNFIDYFEFILDANENQSEAGDQYLSLNDVRIFVSAAGGATTTDIDPPTTLGTIVYSMDTVGNMDNTVLLDTSQSHGSGQGDMTMLVPVSSFVAAFPSINGNTFVYLYAKFGATPDEPENNILWSSTSTPEHFGVDEGREARFVVPAPAALPAGLALLGLVAFRRRRA